jgi:hypothetical protein
MKSFSEFVTEGSKLDKVVKELLKSKNVKTAKINHDNNIDITTSGDVKAWETDGTGEVFTELGLSLKHAYDGLAGKSYEMEIK